MAIASSRRAFSDVLATKQTFIFDCDGVLWRASDPVPGAAETVQALRDAGKDVYFATNNSTKTRATYVSKLASFGIAATENAVVTSAFATARYLRDTGLKEGDKVYVVGEAGLRTELRSVGLQTLGDDDHDKQFDMATFSKESIDHDIRAVVVGFDGRLNFFKLATAACYLRYVDGCRYVATNSDRTFPGRDAILPGGGTIVNAVEFASGTPPETVVGKPNKAMMDVIARQGVDLTSAVMVGDRMNTDIAFGNESGLTTMLVLTGVSSRADADAEPEGSVQKPSFVIDSVADIDSALKGEAEVGAAEADGAGK